MIHITNDYDMPYWGLAPISKYDFSNDTRLLIPFMTKLHKMGMMNHNGDVVIKPKYDIICNDIYTEDDVLKVGVLYPHAYARKNGDIAPYVSYRYGILNSRGETIMDTQYKNILLGINSNCITVNNYYVYNKNGEIVQLKQKYQWIDGFDNGLARVHSDKGWGIINENGDEVLPLEFSQIWNFYDKNRSYTKTIKQGVEQDICLDSMRQTP